MSILSEFQNPLFCILRQKLFPFGVLILYMYLHSSFSLSLSQTFFVSLIVAISAVLCFKALSLFAIFP